MFLNKKYILTGLLILLAGCNNKNIKPVSYFYQHLQNNAIDKSYKSDNKAENIKLDSKSTLSLISIKNQNSIIDSVFDPKKNILYTVNYVGDLSSFDLENKKLLWNKSHFHTKVSNVGFCIGDDNYLYILYSRTLNKLDSDNGNLINYIEFNGTGINNPIFSLNNPNKIYVSTVDGNFYILDAKNFKQLNKFNYMTNDNDLFSKYPNTIALFSNGNVALADIYNNIHVINKDGKEISYHQGAELDVLKYTIFGTNVEPIITDNLVYINHNIDGIKILDNQGNLVKHATISGVSSWHLKNDALFVINKANQIIRLSAKSLKIQWLSNLESINKKPITISQFSSYSNIIEYNGNLIFTDTHGYLYIVDSYDGEIKQRITIKPNISKLILKNNMLYGIGSNKVFYWSISNALNNAISNNTK